jgi:hypothetical protein
MLSAREGKEEGSEVKGARGWIHEAQGNKEIEG